MKYDMNDQNNYYLFTAEIDADKKTPEDMKGFLAINWANKNKDKLSPRAERWVNSLMFVRPDNYENELEEVPEF